MTIEIVREALLWCSVINIGILLFWFVAIALAHDLAYRIHSKFFKISTETFDTVHYAGMTAFKIFIFVVNIVPYCALLIVG